MALETVSSGSPDSDISDLIHFIGATGRKSVNVYAAGNATFLNNDWEIKFLKRLETEIEVYARVISYERVDVVDISGKLN